MKPLGHHILIKAFPKDTVSKGGIIIPPVAQKSSELAAVVAVSEDIDTVVKDGNDIIVNTDAGAMVFYNNEPHLIVRDDQIEAIV